MRNMDVLDATLCKLSEKKEGLAFKEKLFIAEHLDKMGVNAVELPLVQAQKEDKVIYRTISDGIKATVAIPVGETAESVACAFDCVKSASSRRLQVVFPISTVQMEYFYHAKAPKMLDKISAVIAESKKYDAEIEFVAKDATRAEDGFLSQCAKTALEAGADVFTICDDNGDCFPDEFAALVKTVKEVFTGKVYIQPSNKLKLAPAILLECAKAGVDGVKTAMSCCSLKAQTVAELLRAKGSDMGVQTTLDYTLANKTAKEIGEVSKKGASEDSKVNKMTFDENATLKDITDEVISLGYELSSEDMGKVFEEFKRVCSKKGEVGERELEAIVAVTAMQVPSTYHLNTYVVNSGNIMTATASVTLEKDGEELSGVSVGDGPIDAAFHAIEQIIGHHYELDDFNVQAVTKGREAVGSAIIRLRAEGKLYAGNGVSTDVVGACIRAYINALNKIVYEKK